MRGALQVSVPDWPFYNRNPLEWLPVSSRALATLEESKDASTPTKKPRKPTKCAPHTPDAGAHAHSHLSSRNPPIARGVALSTHSLPLLPLLTLFVGRTQEGQLTRCRRRA